MACTFCAYGGDIVGAVSTGSLQLPFTLIGNSSIYVYNALFDACAGCQASTCVEDAILHGCTFTSSSPDATSTAPTTTVSTPTTLATTALTIDQNATISGILNNESTSSSAITGVGPIVGLVVLFLIIVASVILLVRRHIRLAREETVRVEIEDMVQKHSEYSHIYEQDDYATIDEMNVMCGDKYEVPVAQPMYEQCTTDATMTTFLPQYELADAQEPATEQPPSPRPVISNAVYDVADNNPPSDIVEDSNNEAPIYDVRTIVGHTNLEEEAVWAWESEQNTAINILDDNMSVLEDDNDGYITTEPSTCL